MPVVDIQSWADGLEDLRIPAIESDVFDVQQGQAASDALITQKAQEFMDLLAINHIKIQSNKVKADQNNLDVTDALQQVYGTELAARIYTDNAIQTLKDSFDLTNIANRAYIDGPFRDQTDAEVAALLPSMVSATTALTAQAQAAADQATAVTDSAIAAANLALNDTLPILETMTDNVALELAGLSGDYAILTADYSHNSLVDGINSARAEAEGNLPTADGSVLRAPRTYWSNSSTAVSGSISKSTLGASGTFVEDDPDFGECYEFSDGIGDQLIGQAYPMVFDPSRIYKVEVLLKAVDDGSGSGVSVHLGVTTQKGTTQIEANQENVVAGSPFVVADGMQTVSVYFSADTAAMTAHGIDVADYIELANSSTATLAYFHVRQNSGDVTSGQLRVASIYTTDVTEAINAANGVRTELNASIGNLSATLATTGSVMADIAGNATAAYTLRAVAGGNAADFELVAWDNVTGGGSAIKMNAEHILLDGTVSMDHLNAASVSAAGLNLFDGKLTSDNFDGTIDGSGTITDRGTEGFALTSAGKFVATDIIARQDLQVGSVSGGGSFVDDTPKTSSGVLFTFSMGAIDTNSFSQVAVQAQIRSGGHYSTVTVTGTGGDKDPYQYVYHRWWRVTNFKLEYNLNTGSGWELLWESGWTTANNYTATDHHLTTILLKDSLGNNAQLRGTLETNVLYGGQGSVATVNYNNLEYLHTVAKAILR